MIASSSVCMPYCLPVWMAEGIWTVLPSRMRLPTAAVQTRISSAAQRRAERARVDAHFSVVDQAALRLVHELDRVLDRDDVVLAVLVGVVDDGGQRGGLAGAGRPRHQDQALVQHGRFLEERRQPEVVGGQHLGRDLAEDGAAAVL